MITLPVSGIAGAGGGTAGTGGGTITTGGGVGTGGAGGATGTGGTGNAGAGVSMRPLPCCTNSSIVQPAVKYCSFGVASVWTYTGTAGTGGGAITTGGGTGKPVGTGGTGAND